MWNVGSTVHIFQNPRIDGHGIHRGAEETADILALVSSRIGVVVLLAFVCYRGFNWVVFRINELFSACDDVRLLFPDGGGCETQMVEPNVDNRGTNLANGGWDVAVCNVIRAFTKGRDAMRGQEGECYRGRTDVWKLSVFIL